MAHKTLIGGTAYEISGGKTLVDGTAYSIKNGKTLIDGTAYEIGFGPDVVIVDITESGVFSPINTVAVYVGGKRYYNATSGIEVKPGDTIRVDSGPPFPGTAFELIIDGELIVSGELNYTLTIPNDISKIAIHVEDTTGKGLDFTVTITTS